MSQSYVPSLLVVSMAAEMLKNTLRSHDNPLKLVPLEGCQEGVGGKIVVNAVDQRLQTVNEQLHSLRRALHNLAKALFIPFLCNR